jgi:AcrR family transcriptional regulator
MTTLKRSSETRAKSGRYHHGDLRNALVQAGLELVERHGLAELSLRAVATAVGVSHAAPAHHFGSLRALRNALAIVGYERFAAAIQAERRRAPVDPASQMRAASDGYLEFAVANPALFRLMFSADQLDWSDEQLLHAARLSRAELTDICEPAVEILGLHGSEQRAELERLVWAAAHGRAHLTIDGQMPGPTKPSTPGGATLDIADLVFSRLTARPRTS